MIHASRHQASRRELLLDQGQVQHLSSFYEEQLKRRSTPSVDLPPSSYSLRTDPQSSQSLTSRHQTRQTHCPPRVQFESKTTPEGCAAPVSHRSTGRNYRRTVKPGTTRLKRKGKRKRTHGSPNLQPQPPQPPQPPQSQRQLILNHTHPIAMSLQTAGDIPILISSENSGSERRITPSWTIGQLKAKLEPVTGIPPLSQKLLLKRAGQPSLPIEANDEENTQLAAFSLAPYSEILVSDVSIRSATSDLAVYDGGGFVSRNNVIHCDECRCRFGNSPQGYRHQS